MHFNHQKMLSKIFFSFLAFAIISCDEPKTKKKQDQKDDSLDGVQSGKSIDELGVSFSAGAIAGNFIYFRDTDNQIKYKYDLYKNVLTKIDFAKPASEYYQAKGEVVDDFRIFSLPGNKHAIVKDHFYIGFSTDLSVNDLKLHLNSTPNLNDLLKKIERLMASRTVHKDFVLQVLAGGSLGNMAAGEPPSISYGNIGGHRYVYFPEDHGLSIDGQDEEKKKYLYSVHHINGAYRVFIDKTNDRVIVHHNNKLSVFEQSKLPNLLDYLESIEPKELKNTSGLSFELARQVKLDLLTATTKELHQLSIENLKEKGVIQKSFKELCEGSETSVDQQKSIIVLKGTLQIENCEELNTYLITHNDLRPGRDIEDLSIFREFSNISRLNLDRSETKDLSPIEDLIGLQYLNLDSIKVENIGIVSKFINLKYLNMHYGSYGNIDFVQYLTDMREILYQYSNAVSLSPLAGLTKLFKIDATGNRISDIASLAKLFELKDLNLRHNEIVDLSPLADLAKIEILNIAQNRIESIEALKKYRNLKFLSMAENQITDFSPIESKNIPKVVSDQQEAQ